MDIIYDGSDMAIQDEDVPNDDGNSCSDADDDTSSGDEIQAAWHISIPLVVLALQKSRAEKRAERRQLWQSERALESNTCEKKLLDLLHLLDVEAHTKKKEENTLSSTFRAQEQILNAFFLVVQGLNTVHAGQKCQ
ncbi:hypothetical protein BGZ95_011557 [Linnemannia exigua]|uniref:Uncharacterized protein n=1 Tax=Linnemannia exigua TaxID=604196 RepID=A0AAD4DA85_9FUNG|nr:hypothetical protein BGZ95_011557 [Linnemannia exigua]